MLDESRAIVSAYIDEDQDGGKKQRSCSER